MPSYFLTKSAFKIARSCATKLYYYRSGYPSILLEDPYLKFLADGGHIVGKLAQLLYPDGILIDSCGDLDRSVERTNEELKKENVTLFEAAFRAGNKLVLVDVLEKRGDIVKLIEVKSKSYDSEKDREYRDAGKRTLFTTQKKSIDSTWQPYLDDICFQNYVASLAHPEFEYIPYLCMPDKAKTTSIEGLASMFSIRASVDSAGRKRFIVDFNGDASRVRADHFMTWVNVEDEVAILWNEVKDAAERFEPSLFPILTKIQTEISRQCSDCEYRNLDPTKSGYFECWGELGEVSPHLFDLHFGSALDKGRLYDSLISARQVSLYDIPLESLTGKRGTRQTIQVTHTQKNQEWVSPDLKGIIESVKYPLHFIDFETSRVAIPYHSGMRPYEQVAFQWSCHTLPHPGADPVHSEWINTLEAFPNFEFATTLRNQIGEYGSVLTWAHHEATVLGDICEQMEKYGKEDQALREWIQNLIHDQHGRILDLNRVTLDNYFHPDMKGRTSLKWVLPAVWNNHLELHEIAWLQKYVAYDGERKVLDPYKVLSKIEIAGKAEVVNEGTGAMRAYQDMMFGMTRDDLEMKETWKRLLLQYCELDTIAMLVVWRYWESAVFI